MGTITLLFDYKTKIAEKTSTPYTARCFNPGGTMATKKQPQLAHQHERGTITDNALKAVVTSKLFTTRVVKAKKGKGSYSRKGRNSKDYGLVVCGFPNEPQAISSIPQSFK